MKRKNRLIILIILFIVSVILYKYHLNYYRLYINNNNQLVVKVTKDNTKCQLVSYNPLEEQWIDAIDNQCIFNLEDKEYKLFLKTENKKPIEIKKINHIGKVLSTKLNTNKVYIALNETYTPYLNIDSIGNVNKTIIWTSSNQNIVKIDDNKLVGVSLGTAQITAYFRTNKYTLEVEVTDILDTPNQPYDKEYLQCAQYTEEENNLLDNILQSRIENVGLTTRSATVEAARFLTLSFPYKINYFYENGRETTFDLKPYASGEGRYYNKGLYLHESRYSNVLTSINGPAIWGCDLYSNIENTTTANGLNCSGFMAWVFLNAGFDPGDIGAGITKVQDFTDLGTKEKLNQDILTSTQIKSGDLLYSSRVGGHIAIIVGIDEKNFYVAEAYWDEPRGVVINTYDKNKIANFLVT